MTTATTAPGDVAAAERELTRAAAAVATAESQVIATGGKSVTAAQLHKVRDEWRHADLTAQGARQRAEQERRAARLAALEQIGAQVDQLAAAGTSGLAEALQAVTAACSKVRQLAAAHDSAVAELIAAAADLGTEPMAPAGPRSTSGYVAVLRDTIIHKHTQIRPAGDRISLALAQAVAGDTVSAVATVDLVTIRPEPTRAKHYLRHRSGAIHVLDNLTDALQTQIRSKDLKPLTEAEIQAYQEGTLA